MAEDRRTLPVFLDTFRVWTDNAWYDELVSALDMLSVELEFRLRGEDQPKAQAAAERLKGVVRDLR